MCVIELSGDMVYGIANWLILALLVGAALVDYRTYRIPNKIIVTTLGIVSIRIWAGGGLKEGLIGFIVGLAIGIVARNFGIGGGDAKMMAVLGAYLGVNQFFLIMYMAIIMASIWGVWQLNNRGVELREVVTGIQKVVTVGFSGGLKFDPPIPFGVCLAVPVLIRHIILMVHY